MRVRLVHRGRVRALLGLLAELLLALLQQLLLQSLLQIWCGP